MHLTKEDLDAISNMIDEKLENKFEEKLSPIREEIAALRSDTEQILPLRADVFQIKDYQLVVMQQDIHQLKADVKILQTDMSALIGGFVTLKEGFDIIRKRVM
jgi:hypothetical protein